MQPDNIGMMQTPQQRNLKLYTCRIKRRIVLGNKLERNKLSRDSVAAESHRGRRAAPDGLTHNVVPKHIEGKLDIVAVRPGQRLLETHAAQHNRQPRLAVVVKLVNVNLNGKLGAA